MKIFRSLEELEPVFPNVVLTIGNFDGIHLGHREIFRKVVKTARDIQGTGMVFTFVPHPLKVLDPVHAPSLINTYEEKERLISASCIDALVCAPFTIQTASITAEDFVKNILVEKIGIRHLIVGYDYAFGRDRQGNVEYLRTAGLKNGFDVQVLPPISHSGEVFSSTRIRQCLYAGDVSGVVRLLGRHFNLEGQVMHGAKRGHRIGFPTANLKTEKELLPRNGVYAVKVKHRDQILDGVVNIGCNPTFRVGGISIEVHILDFSGDLYGEDLRIYFVERLREEILFPSANDLIRAINHDISRAREILAEKKIIEYREYLDCGMSGGDVQ